MNKHSLYLDYTKDIYLSFTRKCNFSCPYCYCKNLLSDQTLPSIKKIDAFLFLAKKMAYLQSITLIGGEPLIHKASVLYFLEKIYQINSTRTNKIYISIFTNGSFYLSLRKYRSFIKDITIALAGFRTDHNRVRYYKNTQRGTFDKITRNYIKYKNDGLPVKFNYIVTPASIKTLFQSIEKIITHLTPTQTVMSIQFDHFSPWGKHLSKILMYYIYIYRINKKYKQHWVSAHHLNQVQQGSVCTAGTSFIGVDLYSGTIHNCHENNGSGQDIIGNLTLGISDKTIQKNIRNRNLKLYHYNGIPRTISFLFIKLFGGYICKMRNDYHCRNSTCIPTYYLFIYLCTKAYNFLCWSKHLLHNSK